MQKPPPIYVFFTPNTIVSSFTGSQPYIFNKALAWLQQSVGQLSLHNFISEKLVLKKKRTLYVDDAYASILEEPFPVLTRRKKYPSKMAFLIYSMSNFFKRLID